MEQAKRYSKGFRDAEDALHFRQLIMDGYVFQAQQFLESNCKGSHPIGWDALCIYHQDEYLMNKWIEAADPCDFTVEDYDLDQVFDLAERRDIPLIENGDLDLGFRHLSYFLRDRMVEERPAGKDYLIQQDDFLNAQQGYAPMGLQETTGEMTRIETGRDLATYVHGDNPFIEWMNIVDDLIYNGVDFDLPGRDRFSHRIFMYGLIGEVISRAWVTAFCLKYIYLLIRPETLARSRGLVLPMAYAEGCPLHPTRPSGHSFIASALEAAFCVVVSTSHYLPSGFSVGEELGLYRANVENGRMYAGVHVRKDNTAARSLAIQLGNSIAVARRG